MELVNRPRRLRSSENLRSMVRQTRMSASSLIYPLFVMEGGGICEEIRSMPGQFRYSVDNLWLILDQLAAAGVLRVMLFGIPDHKDETGSGAWDEKGVVQNAIRHIRQNYPQFYIITDVCLCEYTSHGHCGILCGGEVDNDATLPLLAKTALSHVAAGADMLAPSDMMDGRVGEIRRMLDKEGYINSAVLAYSAKYASSFYGPFREAAGSAPSFGDRKSYQMDYHNRREAAVEVSLDLEEGADIIMVKPALSYLDVISDMRSCFDVPLAAYSVSGEYAMIKAAASLGYIDEDAMVCETATSIFRAGADVLLTYYAPQIAGFIKEGRIG